MGAGAYFWRCPRQKKNIPERVPAHTFGDARAKRKTSQSACRRILLEMPAPKEKHPRARAGAYFWRCPRQKKNIPERMPAHTFGDARAKRKTSQSACQRILLEMPAPKEKHPRAHAGAYFWRCPRQKKNIPERMPAHTFGDARAK